MRFLLSLTVRDFEISIYLAYNEEYTVKHLNSGDLSAWAKIVGIQRCPQFGCSVKIVSFDAFLRFLFILPQTFSEDHGQELGSN